MYDDLDKGQVTRLDMGGMVPDGKVCIIQHSQFMSGMGTHNGQACEQPGRLREHASPQECGAEPIVGGEANRPQKHLD